MTQAALDFHDPLAFADLPFKMKTGLKACGMGDWLATPAHFQAQRAERARMLDSRHREVFAALPEADAASAELLAAVRAWQAAFRAGLAEPDLPTGLHPLEQAGRLVSEDLCVLQPADGTTEPYRLTGACLCFPSHWSLHDKLGKSLDGIHGPVPGYAEHLQTAMNRVFRNLKPGKLTQRSNMSVDADPDLFHPSYGRDADPPVTADDAGERLYLRMERQTLRRLPETGAVVFAIGIYKRRLKDAVGPQDAAQLAAYARGMPRDMWAYKSFNYYGDALVAWLDRRAAAT